METTKKAVKEILSAVKTRSLRQRLEKCFSFNRTELRKIFKKFMAHAMGLAAEFQNLDCGPKNRKARKDISLKRTDGSGISSNSSR